jgi:hypothetical protein
VALTDHILVRIAWPVDEQRSFTGTPGVARLPRVGDVGVVVNAYSQDTFAVECVDAHGMTLWLADFHIGEIEPIESRDPLAPPEIDVELAFLPVDEGGRERAPDLSAGAYRPHFRVPPSTEMLGVQFQTGPYGQIRPGSTISVTARPLFGAGVPYDLLRPGVAVEVVEGAQVVARGHVTRVR